MVTPDDMAEAVREYRLEAEDALHALLTLLEGPPRIIGGRETHRLLSRVLTDFGQAFAPLTEDDE